MLGVFDVRWVRPIAEVLKGLGSQHVLVVHSEDGLDEISIAAPTQVAELKDGRIMEYVFNPQDYGYSLIQNSDIQGRDPDYNAKTFMQMLEGLNKKFQHIVELNAGAALYLSQKSKSFKEGFELARHVIEKNITKQFLEKLINYNE